MDLDFYKKGTYRYLLKHYDRKGTLPDKADATKTPLNKTFGDQVDFETTIKGFIEETKKTYKRSLKRTATLMGDWVLQVPKEIENNPTLMNRFFELATKFTKERYGYITKGFSHLDEINVFKDEKSGSGKKITQTVRPHIHIAFIPYGDYIDKRDNKQKRGFNYGFRFNSKKELIFYQKDIERYLTEEFRKLGIPSLDFGEGNSIVGENGKKLTVKDLKEMNYIKLNEKDEIISQYEQVISTQKELFFERYKDNPQVKSDYIDTFNKGLAIAQNKSPKKHLFARVVNFVKNMFYKVKKPSKTKDDLIK